MPTALALEQCNSVEMAIRKLAARKALVLDCSSTTRTRFAVNVLGFEVARLEGDERERRVGRMVAQRDEQLSALVLQRRLQRLPEHGLLRKVDLCIVYC